MKMFKIEQGLFNLVQSYLLELETLETKIVLKLPNSKISEMLVKICLENNGQGFLNGCKDYFLNEGFTVQRKEVVLNDNGLLGQRFYILYDLPNLELIENTFELTTVPTPVTVNQGIYLYQKWELPRVIGVMAKGKIVFDMNNCEIRSEKTYFCDNSIIYENFQTQCPESIVLGTVSADFCEVTYIKSVQDCIFNRNIRGNMVIVGHFNSPVIKTKVKSGIPTQTQKQEFRENRNVTVLELNDQVTAVECKNTIFKHGGVIRNPRQIAVKISDTINIENLRPELYLESWGKQNNKTEKVQNELEEIVRGFSDRSNESINKPWWEFWNLSETNKHKILMSSLFALILLFLGTILSTKC